MKIYKKGDIMENGFEVMEVAIRYEYKIRKKIVITTDFNNLKDKEAYFYMEGRFNWIELKDGKTIRLREKEYKFVD